jgi:hypothetical protein
MYELPRTIPDVKMLLALAPEELASTILFLLKKRNEAKFHTGNLPKELWGHHTSGQPQYPRQHENEINLALSEAWAWLKSRRPQPIGTTCRCFGVYDPYKRRDREPQREAHSSHPFACQS